MGFNFKIPDDVLVTAYDHVTSLPRQRKRNRAARRRKRRRRKLLHRRHPPRKLHLRRRHLRKRWRRRRKRRKKNRRENQSAPNEQRPTFSLSLINRKFKNSKRYENQITTNPPIPSFLPHYPTTAKAILMTSIVCYFISLMVASQSRALRFVVHRCKPVIQVTP